MTSKVEATIVLLLACVVGTGLVAAPGQDRRELSPGGSERPGQPTKGQVWIENRGRNEAIPIVAAAPVPVLVQNPARPWDYQTIAVPRDVAPRDLTRMLAMPGNEGWELTNAQVVSGGSTLLILKRPRPETR